MIAWAWKGVCGCDSLDCCCHKVCVRREREGECGCDCVSVEGCVGVTA